MNNEKEMTAPVVSVGADTEQSSQNLTDSLTDFDSDFKGADDDFYREMQRRMAPDYLETVSMTTLYDTDFEGQEPLIDGLLYRGAYLLAGSPKVGKSFLMAQLAYQVSTGLPLWGYKVRKTGVLYFALEDNYARLQRRLFRMFGAEAAENLYFATHCKTTNSGLEDQIRSFMKEHPNTGLIIIDTLKRVREVGGADFSYSSDYDIVARLKTVADSYMDEATPHIHIDFVPFTTGSKRGLDTRVSLKQALAVQGFKGGTRGATEWAQWVQSEKEQLADVMERYDIQWEQKGTHEKHLSVLDYKKQEREKEIAALDSTLAEKQDELETVQNRIDNFDQGTHSIERLKQRIESDAEFQLPDPPTLMTAKTYKQRFVDPLIRKLKEVIREVFYHYYKALDSYHRLNNTNGRLYRENEHLTIVNDKLKGENEVLRSELKDFRFLRKVLGSQQIDNLIAQAKDMEQQRKQTQRTRRRNTNYER